MPKIIQVRDVSDRAHRILKARAAREGMSLSEFVKQELERSAERPTQSDTQEPDIAANFRLPITQVRAILSYAAAHQDAPHPVR